MRYQSRHLWGGCTGLEGRQKSGRHSHRNFICSSEKNRGWGDRNLISQKLLHQVGHKAVKRSSFMLRRGNFNWVQQWVSSSGFLTLSQRVVRRWGAPGAVLQVLRLTCTVRFACSTFVAKLISSKTFSPETKKGEDRVPAIRLQDCRDFSTYFPIDAATFAKWEGCFPLRH